MNFIHSIWFGVTMISLMSITMAFSICMHRHNYKYEHLASKSSYWCSLVLMLIICLTLIVVWAINDFASIWEYFQRIEQRVRYLFPTLFAFAITVISLFVVFLLLRPRLKISHIAAFIPSTGRLVFNVKNHGFFGVQNVKPELYICTFQRNKVVKPVTLDLQSISSLDGCFSHKDLCCVDFATPSTIDEQIVTLLKSLTERQCLEFRVSSTHVISGKSMTEVNTFYKNDILVGKFDNDDFYYIDDKGDIIKKAQNPKNRIDTIHTIFIAIEIVIFILLLLTIGWVIGGKFVSLHESYVYIAKLLSICLFILELLRVGTDIPLESSYNSSWTYEKFIPADQGKPISTDKMADHNLLDFVIAGLQVLNKKVKNLL